MIHLPTDVLAQAAGMPSPGPGQSDVVVADTLTHALVAGVTKAMPRDTVPVIWVVKLEPGWHIYYKNPGDSGLAPMLKAELPGAETKPLTFPTPKRIDIDPITNYGYETEAMFGTEIVLPDSLPEGPIIIPIKLEYLYCSDICLPGEVSMTLPLVISNTGAELNPMYGGLLQAYVAGQPKIWPVEASATVQIVDKAMQLRFTPPPAADGSAVVAKTASFIPDEEEQIHDNAPQPYEDNTLLLMPDASLPAMPQTLKGILVIDGVGYKLPDLTVQPAAKPTQRGALDGGLGVILLAMGGAFLAGLILNLMPCVLPILAIKVLSAVRHQTHHEREVHAVGYTLGVLITFWALALVIIGLTSAGHALGWGFHLQNPLFVAALSALMLVLGMNFMGTFSVGESFTRMAAPAGTRPALAYNPRHAFAAAVGTGVLAVLVSTPCTVPFMGGAMAFALNQTAAVTLMVFTALGLGLAAPFVLLTTLPFTRTYLPKPGAWMQTFKQILAWPLFATALWLAYVFANQTGVMPLFKLFIGLMLLAFALWYYGKKPDWRRRALVVLALLAGAMLVGDGTRAKLEVWEPWSKARELQAREENPVFVDFTADWCITCKVVESTVLNTKATQELFARSGTILLQGDWTRQDAAITAELNKFGRKGVPLYLLYLPGETEPHILPQFPSREEIAVLLATRK